MKSPETPFAGQAKAAWWIYAVITGCLGAFGLVLAFLHDASWLAPLMGLLWEPFIGQAPLPENLARLLDFVLGILGAVMLSWSVALASLGWQALRRGQTWAWRACLVAALAWFVIDESFSIYFGVTVNALGNLVFLAGLLVPLAMVRPKAAGLLNARLVPRPEETGA